MRFYTLEIKLKSLGDYACEERKTAAAKRCWSITHTLFREMGGRTAVFLSEVNSAAAVGGVLTQDPALHADALRRAIPWIRFGLDVAEITVRETVSSEIAAQMYTAFMNDFIVRHDSVVSLFGLRDLFRSGEGVWDSSDSYEELLLPEDDGGERAEACADRLLWSSLKPEFDRIRQGSSNPSIQGIPVHYLLAGNHFDNRHFATELLLSTLYENGRIQQRRYCEIKVSLLERNEVRDLRHIFEVYRGGAIVFRFRADTCHEHSMADISMETIRRITECILDFRNEVLTVFCFPTSCRKEQELFFDNLPHMTYLTFAEGNCDLASSRHMLEERARRAGYADTHSLTDLITEERLYTMNELEDLYYTWSSGHIKEEAYPQYAAVAMIQPQKKQEPEGTAYERLMQLIGLTEAKRVITDAINYHRMRRLRASRGGRQESAAMHLCFTGNPGTAKTTVARLFAQIMRDNKILSSGHLVEVGRADLVGKYVGWTAPTVQKKVREALGGVLFVDEAYALVDDKAGLYGDEAINTLVQELENHRDDLIVIFAGYPAPMESFLSRNSGLRSRIAHIVPFDDYSAEELCDITRLMARERGLTLADEVDAQLLTHYTEAARRPDFGNGRYVRNYIELASMRQASRLLTLDEETLSDEALYTLTADDFTPAVSAAPTKRKIGFAS